MNIFAEMDVTTQGVLVTCGVFVTVAALAKGANEILRFFDRFKDKPPMDEQIRILDDRIMKRLDDQDSEATVRITTLRTHIDSENTKIHDRVTAHGQQLYELKGFVEGRNSR